MTNVGDTLEEKVKHYYRHVESYDWTRAADSFVGPETFFHRARSREIVRLLESIRPRPARCLDVGCGTALITRRLPPGAVGLDLNPRNLEKARRYAPEAVFINCDVEGRIPLADESFDLAVCTEMLEHLIHPERTVAEIRRVLKAGYWDVHLLVEWWVQEALTTLPPPKDGVLYVVGDGSEKPKRGTQNPLAQKGRKSEHHPWFLVSASPC